MAVYIKNMKKPERCGCCRFTSAFDCNITGEFIEDHNQILDSCPIVETPTTEQSSMVGEWIPCSERMPTKEGHYLCSLAKPNRIDHTYIGLEYWTGDRWYGSAFNGIKAWMPLPKPYKGAE